MDSDALNSSHAVSTEVDTPEQVQEMFDSVSYEKVQVFFIVQLYICDNFFKLELDDILSIHSVIVQKDIKLVKVLVSSYWQIKNKD